MKPDGLITRWLDALLRTPPLPQLPQETGVQVLQPAPAYVTYRLCLWACGHLILLGFFIVVLAGPILGLQIGSRAAGPGIVGALARLSEGLPREFPTAARILIMAIAIALATGAILTLLLAVLRVVAGVFLVRLDARRRWYILGERTLTLREGVTHVREMTFTYANIQDVRLTAGPLSRFFGLAHITVETAGGGGAVTQQDRKPGLQMHRATLAGLANATEVRDALLERQRRCRVGDLGDHPTAGEVPVAPTTQLLPSTGQDLLRELAVEAAALRQAAERLPSE